MKPTVYLETSVIGYLAMRPSTVLQIAAKQQITREWWEHQRSRYELYVSRYVIEECNAGDPIAALERQHFLAGIPLLDVSDEVSDLAKCLLNETVLPQKAAIDALHISVSAVNHVQYLVTWNCRHSANLALRRPIEDICRRLGYRPPILCTPQDLLEIHDGP